MSLYGGEMEAGPRDDGGFAVRARRCRCEREAVPGMSAVASCSSTIRR